MMNVRDFWRSIPDVGRWAFSDQIKLLAWYRKTYLGSEYFTAKDISDLYDTIGAAPPSSIGPFLRSLAGKRVPELLAKGSSYRLEAKVVVLFDEKYGQRPTAVHVGNLLLGLPGRLPSLVERSYLEEAIRCFSVQAFRAAVVMSWNLTYDHLCHWVLTNRLIEFNKQFLISFSNKAWTIKLREDFQGMKESNMLQVCEAAGIITNAQHKLLKPRLDFRNLCAHPSGIIVNQASVEAHILELVENVILKFL